MKVAIVVGTRPEIIKMSSIIKKFEAAEQGINFDIIHTEQHYDYNLNQVFFKELCLPQPDHCLSIGSGTQAQQTANAMVKIENIFFEENPDIVLVQGDTNTVLAGALAGIKAGVRIGHVEAGLRSYDIRMPEEHNRRMTDHIASLLFVPTNMNAEILTNENVWGEIFVTGNTVIDACLEYLPLAEKTSDILDRVVYDRFVLVTAHRAENVDDEKVLTDFVKIFRNSPLPVVYPVHPRAVKRLREFNLYEKLDNSENVQLIAPLGYFDFLKLMNHCDFIMTDSGGIQEEATAPNIRKKVFVLRHSTERPEAEQAGYSEVLGTAAQDVLGRINEFVENPRLPSGPSPYGDGSAGEKIVKILKEFYE